MTSSKTEFRRARPLLGTYFQISIFAPHISQEIEAAVTAGFIRAENLQKKLAKNSQIFWEENEDRWKLFWFSQELEKISKGAFEVRGLDLDGSAKGYIVDEAVTEIRRSCPEMSGIVNAGGDLRFFGSAERKVQLRLGSPQARFFRSLAPSRAAVAASSINVSLQDERSTTRYSKKLRSGLTPDHTVVVVADSCLISDSLTKVGLFGEAPEIRRCSQFFNAEILIFDPDGCLEEVCSPP